MLAISKNIERGLRARKAVMAYIEHEADRVEGDSLGDLLIDLRHYCDAMGFDWERSLALSMTSYEYERAQEGKARKGSLK